MSEALATKDDPKDTLSYRLARAAVIILGVLLVIAFAVLVVGIVMKMSRPGAESATSPAKYSLELGARILSVDSQPGRVILHVRSPAGDEIDIVDVQSGRLVSQIKSASR